SVLLAYAIAVPALAQEASADWDLSNNQRQKLLVAYTQFDNGLSIATRCSDGRFEAVLAGLPPAGRASSRVLRIAFGDDSLSDRQWTVATDDTIAVAEMPAPFARQLREGGRLRVLVPNGAADGRNLMYDLQLPGSSVSIDQTLTACERPLVDPRDPELNALEAEGLPRNLIWAERPAPQYPGNNYARGFAVVSCLSNPDGRLRDCAVESEHPHDGRFGAATLRAARRARVQDANTPGAPVPTAFVAFKTHYIIDGYQTREDQQRQRDNREAERREREARRSTGG
ncbi:MAG TPA: hypothetical protein VLJ13_04950, partial [Brevundimonas sp.]|nr:hypothetical protein [Brevundimonas sp.]